MINKSCGRDPGWNVGAMIRLWLGMVGLIVAILAMAACRKSELPASKAEKSGRLASGLPATPVRQNWRVVVSDKVDPKDIAVSEKQGHTVVWEDPKDPAARIHTVFDIPPYSWDPFPNRDCKDAEHAVNPCRSGRISPLARGRKYTYHVFRTTAGNQKEIDPTIVIDY